MKRLKVLVTAAWILACAITAAGCGGGHVNGSGGGTQGSGSGSSTSGTLVSIALTPADPSMPTGVTKQFTATGSYSNGASVDLTASVTWSSSAPTVANINASGLATSAAAGTTTITATMGGISGSTTLTVTSAVLQSIAVTPATTNLPLGLTQQFTATGIYSDGTLLDLTASVSWASSATTIATVSASGLATPVAAGTTTITAAKGAISGGTTLTVTSAVLQSISAYAPFNTSLPVGLSQQLMAYGRYSDGTMHNLAAFVTWTAGTPAIATVNSSGIATGVSPGSATFTATLSGISGTCGFTVYTASPQSITVIPANPGISPGQTQQFMAVGTYSNGSAFDLTSLATWTSSNTASATVNASGLASGVALGTANITATYGTVSGSTVLTVGTYSIGGTVTGLTGTGLALQDNGGDNLTIAANGAFTFATKLDNGAPYNVSILTQPAGQTCTVHYGSGKVSGANTTVVDVYCGTATIGGTLNGMAAGSTIVLQNNGADNLSLTGNGPFTFATPLSDLAAYSATVLTPPSGQPCTTLYGAGNVEGANVTGINVLCGPAFVGTFSPGPNLSQALAYQTATLLQNGKVLVAGGFGTGGSLSAVPQLYDPATNAWTAAGTLATPPIFHTATLLPNGKVLVAGGNVGPGVVTAAAELYDPATNTWSPAASLAIPRSGASATLLPNGKVLVAGGHGFGGKYLSSTEIYDPATNTWMPGPNLRQPRGDHVAVLLATGKVLVAGGMAILENLTELYDPETNSWTAGGSLTLNRESGETMTLLPNGKVLMAGGLTFNGTFVAPTATTEIYDPATNTWTASGNLSTALAYHTASLLPNGNVLIIGGDNGGNVPQAGTNLYNPATNTWSTSGSLATARASHTATLLQSGKLLVAGGMTLSGATTSSELYW